MYIIILREIFFQEKSERLRLRRRNKETRGREIFPMSKFGTELYVPSML